MNKQDILNTISHLESQKVSENDCDCLTGLLHDCGEWAERINEPINKAIKELRNLLK